MSGFSGGWGAKIKTKTWSEDPAATILEKREDHAPAGYEVAKRADRYSEERQAWKRGKDGALSPFPFHRSARFSPRFHLTAEPLVLRLRVAASSPRRRKNGERELFLSVVPMSKGGCGYT